MLALSGVISFFLCAQSWADDNEWDIVFVPSVAYQHKTLAFDQKIYDLNPAIAGKYVGLEPTVVNGQIEWTCFDLGYDLETYLPGSCN